MKVKVSAASGRVLDWMVAKCEGWDSYDVHSNGAFELERTDTFECLWLWCFTPSTEWAQGGPIVEREKLCLIIGHSGAWIAYSLQNYLDREQHMVSGPTPLIAAMRCFVVSKLGDEVEVPDELI